MSLPSQSYTRNLLLGAMPEDDFATLQPHLVRIELNRNDVLFECNLPIEQTYFLESGVASIVSSEDGEQIEVGILGREGVSGIPVLLGADRTPHRAFMQVGPSTALRMEAGRLRDAANASESLRTILLRFVQAFMVQTAQTATASGNYSLPERLARWLLMCHDRVDGDELELTHDFMAMMLAVRRSGVTVTLHTLEAAGAIRAMRGRVIVRDRKKLLAVAGDSYGRPEEEYRRLIGPFGKSI
ncbi:Crp/Fnr family transcriptional regulator [Sphingosinicella rhizophila]|uniref:Crp/Fnr family transcriptional regulator n=1 Tax=Sphingosinicella rhizophila TaxID=3050082 RepID=A0ABU3Q7J6_9SPHN|nr:Crp/Fnr family transcriptional regulator [Sphingosinicella sp. GR2756]MDT9599379.1 Crp/Fnr family transcriptional regulator [Sphingosinicella sp. GR2756]